MNDPTTRITVHAWISLALGLALGLGGCASKETIFPEDLEPMTAVYDRHFAELRTHGIEGARRQLHRQCVRSAPPVAATSSDPTGASATDSPDPDEDAQCHCIPPTIDPAIPHLAGYTRTAYNEHRALFPRLPNPTLVMYVYPHLAEERAGVPGYATAFPLYERVEYALPGETP